MHLLTAQPNSALRLKCRGPGGRASKPLKFSYLINPAVDDIRRLVMEMVSG